MLDCVCHNRRDTASTIDRENGDCRNGDLLPKDAILLCNWRIASGDSSVHAIHNSHRRQWIFEVVGVGCLRLEEDMRCLLRILLPTAGVLSGRRSHVVRQGVVAAVAANAH